VELFLILGFEVHQNLLAVNLSGYEVVLKVTLELFKLSLVGSKVRVESLKGADLTLQDTVVHEHGVEGLDFPL
jgi:hypothetical protein